jgi:hypothetical protein
LTSAKEPALDVGTYLAIGVLVLLAIGLVLVVYGTITKDRWGINLARVKCPKCQAAMPWVRKPASGREAMWGGYTCPICKTEMDKWGRPIAA